MRENRALYGVHFCMKAVGEKGGQVAELEAAPGQGNALGAEEVSCGAVQRHEGPPMHAAAREKLVTDGTIPTTGHSGRRQTVETIKGLVSG